MPNCLKCGAENALGRMFCFRCGKKLELGEPTAQDLKIKKRSNVVANLSGIVLILLLLAGAVIGLILWPQTDPLGRPPSRAGARQVSLALRGMHMSVGMESVGRNFRESDINAYLKQIRIADLGLDALSVKLTADRIRIRLRQSNAPWHVLWMTFHPTLTRDVTLEPTQGGAVKVVGAQIGHLPLPVTFSESTAARFKALFKGEREMLVFSRVQEIEVKDRDVFLVVGGK